MSRFDALMGAYGRAPLFDLHGETCIYHGFGKPARSIQLIVTRELPEQENTSPAVLADVIDDDELGIALDEIDRGRDEVEVAFDRPGGTMSRRKIANFSEPEGGIYTLELR